MTDLSKLRPEVARAVEHIVQDAHDTDGFVQEAQLIRAELLRLAGESDDLRTKLAEVDADRAKAWANETMWRQRAEHAERERDELRAMLDDPGTTHADGCWTWGRRHYMCARNRIEALTAERDEWRRKVVEAPTGTPLEVDFEKMTLLLQVGADIRVNGQRVALVVVE